MNKLRYKNVRLIVKENRVEVINKENNELIYISRHSTDENMQECIESMTELLSCMGVKFSLNDNYYYKKYNKRIIPAIRISA